MEVINNKLGAENFDIEPTKPLPPMPPSPLQLAVCLPKRFKSMMRAKYVLSIGEMKELGTHLDAIDDPATSEDGRHRHLRAIYENGSYLKLSGNWDEFLRQAFGWNPDQVQEFKRREGIDATPTKTLSTSAEMGTAPVVVTNQSTTSEGPAKPPRKGNETKPPIQTQSPKSRKKRKPSEGGRPDKAHTPPDGIQADAQPDFGSPEPTLTSVSVPTSQSPSPNEASTPLAKSKSLPDSSHNTPPSRSSGSAIDSPEVEIREIPLEQLHRPEELRVRAKTSKETVREYARLYKEGGSLSPISVFDNDGELVIADGNHRFEAATLAGLKSLPCELHFGTFRDALQFALQANVKHGLRLTNADKRHCTEIAIKEFADWSNHLIAAVVGLSHAFVGKVRKQLETVSSSSPRVGRDGKRRKLKEASKSSDTHSVKSPPSDKKAPDAEHRSDKNNPAGDPDHTAYSSRDLMPADQESPGVGEPPFNPKAEWLDLKMHLLEILDDWPQEHRSYLGDRLNGFANNYCPLAVEAGE